MKKLILLSSMAVLMMAQGKKAPASPPAETSVALDHATVSIKYSAPSMKGRKIFGGLVPYDKVWRAGANSATALHTTADIQIGDVMVPKGDYTLYVWPTEGSLQLIINKQTGQWGTEYTEGQDLGRVKMTLTKPSAPVEMYKMTLAPTGVNKAKLSLEWEETVATVPITVK